MTVGSYQPDTTRSVSLTRPMSVLEEEVTGDIGTYASESEDLTEADKLSSHSVVEHKSRGLVDSTNKARSKIANSRSRLPGQVGAQYFHFIFSKLN